MSKQEETVLNPELNQEIEAPLRMPSESGRPSAAAAEGK